MNMILSPARNFVIGAMTTQSIEGGLYAMCAPALVDSKKIDKTAQQELRNETRIEANKRSVLPSGITNLSSKIVYGVGDVLWGNKSTVLFIAGTLATRYIMNAYGMDSYVADTLTPHFELSTLQFASNIATATVGMGLTSLVNQKWDRDMGTVLGYGIFGPLLHHTLGIPSSVLTSFAGLHFMRSCGMCTTNIGNINYEIEDPKNQSKYLATQQKSTQRLMKNESETHVSKIRVANEVEAFNSRQTTFANNLTDIEVEILKIETTIQKKQQAITAQKTNRLHFALLGVVATAAASRIIYSNIIEEIEPFSIEFVTNMLAPTLFSACAYFARSQPTRS